MPRLNRGLQGNEAILPDDPNKSGNDGMGEGIS